jgi:spore germination cell wall hydrolase CwlJ-like protein
VSGILATLVTFLALLINEPNKDFECLAKNVYFEARNQPIEGQYAVAEVTMNRVADTQWPKTVCDVVMQEKQFSWYWDGKSDIPREKQAWDRAKIVAYNYILSPTNYTKGATHFHANYVKPKWKNDLTKTVTIGQHQFYRI